MQLNLSQQESKIVEALIATGRFTSPEEVVEKALAALNAQELEYASTVADVQTSLEDEQAGRLSPISEVADRLRDQHGFSRPS